MGDDNSDNEIEKHIELSRLESLSFLYRCLWCQDDVVKTRFYIVDTIIFKDGIPSRWLFTDKTGILK
jgi:hypothetical protein